jgi:hypothetical protein
LLKIETPKIVLEHVDAIFEGQRAAAKELAKLFPQLAETVQVDARAFCRNIEKTLRRYHTVLYLDIESLVPPTFNEEVPGVLVIAAGKPDDFKCFFKSGTSGLQNFIDSGHLYTFPCGNNAEEADDRLQDAALELAEMSRGRKMNHFFLTRDRGFTITSGSINVNDNNARALVVKPVDATESGSSSRQQTKSRQAFLLMSFSTIQSSTLTRIPRESG